MFKLMKLDVLAQQIQAFLRLMFHDLQEIRKLLSPQLNRKMLPLRFLMLAVATMETFTIFVIAGFAVSINAPQKVKSSFFIKPIFATFPGLASWCDDNRHFLLFMALLIVFFIVTKNLLSALSHWKIALFSESVSREIGSEIMQRFLYSPYLWHLSHQSASALKVLSWRSYVTKMITSLLNVQNYVTTTIFLFAALACVAPTLTFLVYSILTATGILTYKLIRKSADRAGRASAAASLREDAAVSSAMRGIREVLIYRQQPVFLQAVSDAAQEGNEPRAYLAIAPTVPSWVLEACGFGIIAAAMAMLIHFWKMDIAEITKICMLLFLTSWRSMPSLNRVVNLVVGIRGIRPFSSKCLDALRSLRANVMEIPPAPAQDFKITREITLDNIFFRYPEAKSDCLKGITLRIPKGSRIGFIGPSGAGKSTLTTILSGLLEPTSGTMRIDGNPLSPAEREAYRLRVGYVPQNPYLAAGSLAENVAFSEWGKPFDEARVLLACQRAAIDFISPKRGGILMRIGDGGKGVSGGQAQRIAIARALYANPDIIIFDEATSSLDHANERAIQDTIFSFDKSITTLIVAHRLTTIEKCDYLFWLDEGRLLAEGSASEILPRYIKAMEKTAQN